MPSVQVVKHLPVSTETAKKVEEVARTKVMEWMVELKPAAVHVVSGVAANVAVLKITGGDQVMPAVGGAIVATAASVALDRQFNVKHPVPKVAVGALCYTGVTMLMGERITPYEAAAMGLATSAIAEILAAYV